MAQQNLRTEMAGERGLLGGSFFGVPLGDLGWFSSLLMGLATGFLGFFLATFLGIVGLLIANGSGHNIDYAVSYKYIGLPVGVVLGVLALAYLGILWVKRITRKA